MMIYLVVYICVVLSVSLTTRRVTGEHVGENVFFVDRNTQCCLPERKRDREVSASSIFLTGGWYDRHRIQSTSFAAARSKAKECGSNLTFDDMLTRRPLGLFFKAKKLLLFFQ